MSSEAPENHSPHYFRAYFQHDTDGSENGARTVWEDEIIQHIETGPALILTGDPEKNLRDWLRARYQGYVLYNADGSLDDSARFLIKMYLKQQKYASTGQNYFNRHALGVRSERHLQAVFLQMADELGLGVTIPSPYTDMVLKTDLLLETTLSRSEKRKIAIQITMNSRERENKFHTIKQLYGGHNGVKISPNYQADDVCLLFMKDGDKDFTQICHDFTQIWKNFCDEGQSDINHNRSWGEVRIHSVKKRKCPHEPNHSTVHTVAKANEIVSVLSSQEDVFGRLSLPFSPNDFSVLQSTVAEVAGRDAAPGKRDERRTLSYFDDGTERSYFPRLVKIVQKWGNKGWTLAQKPEKMKVFHGRMSPEDYRKLRRLLSENSLELPKKEQKLQEIVEILEHWFPGIYECIDCALCANGTSDQKKRLSSYKKVQPEKSALPTSSAPQPRQISPEQEARRREREEKRRAESQAYAQRMAEEQISFQQRIKVALEGEGEIKNSTEYSKMLRAVVQKLKIGYLPEGKITRKQVDRVEIAMRAVVNIYRRCVELEQEENGIQKIQAYLDDFIRRFGSGGK